MSKAELLNELNRNKQLLANQQGRLKTLSEKYSALEEFSVQCNSRITAFSESMARRKNNLLSLDQFLGRAKSALRYKNMMHNLLTGSDYALVSSSIDQLEQSVSSNKRNLRNEIQDAEEEILRLTQIVERLQYEYDTYPEEVVVNVE